MKKVFCFLFIIFSAAAYSYAAQKIDPYYLNSDVIDAAKQQNTPASKNKPPKQKKIKKQKQIKPKDQRSLNEKTRKLLHLPPPKTIYYHNIDKSKTPVTMEDYYEFSQDKLRSSLDAPDAAFPRENSEFILPEPKFRVISYNSPAGGYNIDLTQLIKNYSAVSRGILSPDKTKIVYTKSYFYPETMQTSSAAYLIPVKHPFKPHYDILLNTNIVQGQPEPIFTSGMENMRKFQFKVLVPLDFSRDSSKLAFKEKTGSNYDGTWVTNIIAYNFKNNTMKKLHRARTAVIDYALKNRNIYLKDYLWDIYPLGWDKKNSGYILYYAYIYTDSAPVFFGTWRINAETGEAKLVSINSPDAEIEQNGFGLKELKLQN